LLWRTQGSVLGPLLFTLYSTPLHSFPHCYHRLYADDDTQLFGGNTKYHKGPHDMSNAARVRRRKKFPRSQIAWSALAYWRTWSMCSPLPKCLADTSALHLNRRPSTLRIQRPTRQCQMSVVRS